MTIELVDEMIGLSSEKNTLMEKLLNLTKDQSDSIKKVDLESLDSILEEKSKYMAEIDELDKKFLVKFNSLKKIEGINTLEELDVDKYKNLKDLKALAKEIYSRLEEMSIVDKNNTKLMELNLETVKKDLKGVKHAKQAYKGYNYEPDVSILLDEKK